jgi:Putative bacterial sensory transduction regulator
MVFRRRHRSDAKGELRSRTVLRRDGVHILPTMPVLQQILDECGLVHSIDEDGDLVVRWEKCSLYFFFYGERQEVLQARMYLNRRFAVDDRTTVVHMLDDWNRTRLFPKAYSVLPDDGLVGICAEQCYDFEVGATREQLKYVVLVWVETLIRFAEWVDEQV